MGHILSPNRLQWVSTLVRYPKHYLILLFATPCSKLQVQYVLVEHQLIKNAVSHQACRILIFYFDFRSNVPLKAIVNLLYCLDQYSTKIQGGFTFRLEPKRYLTIGPPNIVQYKSSRSISTKDQYKIIQFIYIYIFFK